MRKSHGSLVVIGFVTVVYASLLFVFTHNVATDMAFNTAGLHYPYLISN